MSRFQDDVSTRHSALPSLYAYIPSQNLKHNFTIVESLKAIAAKKEITAAQLCIAWVSALGPHVIPAAGSSYVYFSARVHRCMLTENSPGRHKSRTLENLAGADVALSKEEMVEIEAPFGGDTVKGSRYIDGAESRHFLWG